MNNQKGLFIVFEAIDGSGTSTQARLLYEKLQKEGCKVILTEEPSSGLYGCIIRSILTKKITPINDKKLRDRQLAHLFAADRHDHLYNDIDGIVNKVKEGWIVICTRYIMSSLVYNCNNEEEFNFVWNLNKDFPQPDITFFIDCPVEVCLERINQNRPVQDIYENKDKLIETKEKYKNVLFNYNGVLHIVDGTLNKEKQNELIVNVLKDYIYKI